MQGRPFYKEKPPRVEESLPYPTATLGEPTFPTFPCRNLAFNYTKKTNGGLG